MIDLLITVCTSREFEVWKYSYKYIENNIDSKFYILAVPNKDISLFQSLEMRKFKVVDEDSYIGNLRDELKTRLPKEYFNMVGWYLQQFLKIKLAEASSCSSDGVVLIWDSDTLPLKKLKFFDSSSDIFYYYDGDEYHREYFVTIDALLGLEKLNNSSFISQCIVFKKGWLLEMLSEIESKHNKNWESAVLNSINFEKKYAFSEYETLGTYIFSKYKNKMKFCDSTRWNRFGRRLLKGSLESYPSLMSTLNQYDFIAYEKWDKKNWKDKLPTPILKLLIFAKQKILLTWRSIIA